MYSCETVAWIKVLVSQGWVKSEITAQTLYLNRKKRNREAGGGGGEEELRIPNFQGYLRTKGLIKNNLKFSGCDQEIIMWNFQGLGFRP